MNTKEILYRKVIVLTDTGERLNLSCSVADEMKLRHGSVTGYGMSQINLLATQEECNQYCAALRDKGVQSVQIFAHDAPHRPENWPEPCYR